MTRFQPKKQLPGQISKNTLVTKNLLRLDAIAPILFKENRAKTSLPSEPAAPASPSNLCMKRIILLTAVLVGSVVASQAGVNVGIGIGVPLPGVAIAPPPVVVAPPAVVVAPPAVPVIPPAIVAPAPGYYYGYSPGYYGYGWRPGWYGYGTWGGYRGGWRGYNGWHHY